MWFFNLFIGLEEDFKAWKDGFMKSVFPVLVGEVAMSQLTSASASGAVGVASNCECGGKRKKECCKEKTNKQVAIDVHVHVCTRGGNLQHYAWL
jgi:hypothetical protein